VLYSFKSSRNPTVRGSKAISDVNLNSLFALIGQQNKISLFDTEFVLKGIFPKEFSKYFHKAFELRQVSEFVCDFFPITFCLPLVRR